MHQIPAPPPTFAQLIASSTQADWLVEMHEHYRKKGFFRPGDVRRVLGDATEAVSLPPQPTKSHPLLRSE